MIDLEKGSLDRRVLADPDIYQDELEKIFGRAWLMLAHESLIPNPNDFVLPPSLRGSPSGFAPATIDSTNFLKTKSLGVAPQNTDLTITYRAGGGYNTNIQVGELTTNGPNAPEALIVKLIKGTTFSPSLMNWELMMKNIYALGAYFYSDKVVTGFTTLTILISLFGGIQLFSLGIIGEYIGSIFDEVKGRPLYIIEEKINFE